MATSLYGPGRLICIVQVQLLHGQKSNDREKRASAEVLLRLKVKQLGEIERISKHNALINWTEVWYMLDDHFSLKHVRHVGKGDAGACIEHLLSEKHVQAYYRTTCEVDS